MVTVRPRPLASLPTSKCTTGCHVLDQLLGGGLPCGSLTELTGEAAASKTQLSLQLLLSVQLPQQYGGLEGSAVYVYTEGEPAMRRLAELGRLLKYKYPPEALAGIPDPQANIFVEKSISTGAELLQRLKRLRGLLEQQRRQAATATRAHAGSALSGGSSSSSSAPAAAGPGSGGCSGCGPRPVRLLVVDSVAHVFRDMGDSVGVGELAGRTEMLFKISALLRRYADEYNLAVLLINQVMDSMEDGGSIPGCRALQPQPGRSAAVKNTGHTGGQRLMSLGREVVPALGLAWANCVNTRLFLSRCAAADGASPSLFYGSPSHAAAAAAAAGEGGSSGGGSSSGPLAPALRRIQVVFSPQLPPSDCYYVVEQTGVRGLHPVELEQHSATTQQQPWQQQQQWEQQPWQQQQQWEQQHWEQQQQQQQHWEQQQQQQQHWEQQQQQQQHWEQQQQQQQHWEQQQQQQQHWEQQQQQQQHWEQQQQQQQHWEQQQQQQQHWEQQQQWELQRQGELQQHGHPQQCGQQQQQHQWDRRGQAGPQFYEQQRQQQQHQQQQQQQAWSQPQHHQQGQQHGWPQRPLAAEQAPAQPQQWHTQPAQPGQAQGWQPMPGQPHQQAGWNRQQQLPQGQHQAGRVHGCQSHGGNWQQPSQLQRRPLQPQQHQHAK